MKKQVSGKTMEAIKGRGWETIQKGRGRDNLVFLKTKNWCKLSKKKCVNNKPITRGLQAHHHPTPTKGCC